MKRRTFTASEAGSLLSCLVRELEVSQEDAEALLKAGAVYIQGRRVGLTQTTILAGASILVVLEESGQAAGTPVVAPPNVTVLYQDARLLAVDKPAGLLSQPGPSGGPNVLEQMSKQVGQTLWLVHRLDRETSGVMVLAKTQSAAGALGELFKSKRARKEYRALVSGTLPESGTIDLPLSKDPSRPGRWRASRAANGVPALTDFKVVGNGQFTQVALFPKTGRTHQLRAHLKALNAPIVGDSLYGGDPKGHRCMLHARHLELDGDLKLEAPLPKDFEELL